MADTLWYPVKLNTQALAEFKSDQMVSFSSSLHTFEYFEVYHRSDFVNDLLQLTQERFKLKNNAMRFLGGFFNIDNAIHFYISDRDLVLGHLKSLTFQSLDAFDVKIVLYQNGSVLFHHIDDPQPYLKKIAYVINDVHSNMCDQIDVASEFK